MVYDLTIGILESYTSEYGVYRHVKPLELNDAPAFPGAVISAQSNMISIPSSGAVMLQQAFEEIDPALAQTLFIPDDANVSITPSLVEALERARDAFKAKQPQTVPRFDTNADNAILARMELLAWWTRFALGTYKEQAVIHIR